MINEINPSMRYQPLIQPQKINEQEQVESTNFADTMKGFLNEVNDAQKNSAEMTEKFIKGENVEIHDVMIAGQKAKTTFQLLMELRNRGLDLYREVQRMQV